MCSNETEFDLSPTYIEQEIANVRQSLEHYNEIYNNTKIKNLPLKRLIVLKNDELRLLNIILNK